MKKKKILVIHWYIQPRKNLELTDMEKFHIYELKKYNLKNIFNAVDVCLSIDDTNNTELLSFCENILTEYFGKKLITHIQKNDKISGEFNTYKEFILDRLSLKNTLIFYCHFKGVSDKGGSNFKPSRINWSKNMYHHCFSDEVLNKLDNYALLGAVCDPNNNWEWYCTYLWLNSDEYKPFLKLDIKSNRKYTAGSFQWINTDLYNEYLNNNGFDITIFNNINFSLIRRTHVCEYLLTSLLDDKFKFFKYDGLQYRKPIEFEFDEYENKIINNLQKHNSDKPTYIMIGPHLIRKK